MKRQLRWLVARLGEDMNWWVEETSDEVHWGADALSLLDPRQVAYLREELERYEEYGFDPASLWRVFHCFEISSELPDGRVKLVASAHSIEDEDVQLFALPDLFDQEDDAYPVFLDALTTLRIKHLNATHHYARNLDELDMEEEIQARNADRYFSARAIHVFNELEDVLTWKPAEWDEDESEPQRAELTEDEDDEPER